MKQPTRKELLLIAHDPERALMFQILLDWLDDLENQRYRQTIGYSHIESPVYDLHDGRLLSTNHLYCTMGVLTLHLNKHEGAPSDWSTYFANLLYKNEAETQHIVNEIIQLNDSMKLKFPEIAAYIRNHPLLKDLIDNILS